MTRIAIDAALRDQLLAAGDTVELRDETGMLVAHAVVHVPRIEPPHVVGGEAPTTRGLYDRFTDRSRHVMQLANKEAIRFNREYIGTGWPAATEYSPLHLPAAYISLPSATTAYSGSTKIAAGASRTARTS